MTSASRGALAVLRIWGPDALAVADRVFRPARGVRLAIGPRDRPRFGRAGEGLGDEVVAAISSEEPPEVEFHCHGGPAPVALVMQAILEAGAKHGSTESRLVRSSRESVASEALTDLSQAPTLRTAEILLEQTQGALERDLEEIVRLLTRKDSNVSLLLNNMIERGKVGTRLITGWSVAIAGRPNVGKSRLLNALAGYDRAIVDPSPGTTRDVISFRTAFEGWPVELYDTAGLRESGDAIEAAGIVMARARQAEADLTLLVLDRSEPLTPMDVSLLENVERTLVVINKSDLAASWEPWERTMNCVSAENGEGLERLGREIARRLVPEVPPPGAGVPFRGSHLEILNLAARFLKSGKSREAIAELQTLILLNQMAEGSETRADL